MVNNNNNRKNRFIFLNKVSVCAMLFSIMAAWAQEAALQQKIKTVQEFMTSVEANKLTYVQDLKTISPGYFDYTVTEVNDKGQEKETVYSFGLSDINAKSVRSFTKKDVFLIELVVNGKQKLIKRTTDEGDKVTYLADFTMYGLNADNGRDLEKAIEDAIPDAVTLDENAISLSTYDDHLKWLETNVTNVTLPKDQITQQLTVDISKPVFVILEQTSNSKKERFEFNLSILNPNSVNYKISGSEFSIEIGTKKGMNGVKFLQDRELKDFIDRVTFYASSLSNGKDIHRVLKGIVPFAETKFEKSKPKFESVDKALKYLNDHMDNIVSDERTTTQNVELADNMATVFAKESVADKSEDHEYVFDLTDLNKSGMSFKNKKTRLFLELNTNKAAQYIKHIENSELQNYEKTLMLYFDSIDEAIIAEEALKFLVEHYENKRPNREELSAISLEEALALLKPQVASVVYGDAQFEQHIEILETETSTLKFTKVESDAKNSQELIHEFSMLDLNKRQIEVKVTGKRVWAELGTKGSEKVVKLYKDGQVQNYQNKVEIEASDIGNAKQIVAIFKRLAESQK